MRERALEIATTFALEPNVMLLDEPTAGMRHEDVERIATLIGAYRPYTHGYAWSAMARTRGIAATARRAAVCMAT
jgi:energy-coupling factor transporter ATP-binding protein EcfA2